MEGSCDFRMITPRRLLTDRQCTLQKGLGFSVTCLVVVEIRKIMEGMGNIRVLTQGPRPFL